MSTTLATTYLSSKFIRLFVQAIRNYIDLPYVKEIIPMSFHIIALIFIGKKLSDEWKEQKVRKVIYMNHQNRATSQSQS